MVMGAVGLAGQILEVANGSPIDLQARSDAFWVRMQSEEITGSGGNLASAEADVTRVRLVLEGSRAFALAGERTLTPSMEIGLRHDAGDAERGAGVELGAGLNFAGAGFSVEGQVRTLLSHEEQGYEEWGASGAIRIDPGQSGRGLNLTLAPAWGTAGSGVERLWSLRDTQELAPEGDFEAGSKLDTEVGYGIGLRNARGVVTPFTGLSLGESGNRAYRAGARWNIAPEAVLGLEMTRTEGSEDIAATNSVTLRASVQW